MNKSSILGGAVLALLIAGCATTPSDRVARQLDKKDSASVVFVTTGNAGTDFVGTRSARQRGSLNPKLH